jgi:hypothetical protein
VKRFPFPTVELTDSPRLPRDLSDGPGAEHTSHGRALIALIYRGPRGKKRVALVRNCYAKASGTVVMVENIREYVPKMTARNRSRSLPSLLATGMFSVLQPPFLVAEPVTNCMLEMAPEQFEAIFAENRVPGPTAAEARLFQPETTPLLRLFKFHWSKHRVRNHWDKDRVLRLCQLWGLTPFELAELIQWPPGHMNTFLRAQDDSPWRLPGPVAVWFYFLENFRFGVSIFPTLPEQQEAKAS